MRWRALSISPYFKSEKLQALFSYQNLYVGLSPYSAPGVFALLAATELTDGVWYPIGGFDKAGRVLKNKHPPDVESTNQACTAKIV